MQTFDQSLFQLYKSGLITLEEALRRATNPDEFKLRIQGIQSTADIAREEMESTLEGSNGMTEPFASGSPLRLRRQGGERSVEAGNRQEAIVKGERKTRRRSPAGSRPGTDSFSAGSG